jgi:hypothetical protein
MEFETYGFPCLIHRAPLGHWCGYVAVPPGHPWHGKDIWCSSDDGIDAPVHGGLTYADKCSGEICHVAKPGEPDDVWWLGFDCAHSGDLCPGTRASLLQCGVDAFGYEVYRDISYVTAETQRLAGMALEELAKP